MHFQWKRRRRRNASHGWERWVTVNVRKQKLYAGNFRLEKEVCVRVYSSFLCCCEVDTKKQLKNIIDNCFSYQIVSESESSDLFRILSTNSKGFSRKRIDQTLLDAQRSTVKKKKKRRKKDPIGMMSNFVIILHVGSIFMKDIRTFIKRLCTQQRMYFDHSLKMRKTMEEKGNIWFER